MENIWAHGIFEHVEACQIWPGLGNMADVGDELA